MQAASNHDANAATDDAGGLLFSNMQLAVGVQDITGTGAPATCDASGFSSYTAIALTGTGLAAAPASTATQTVQAAGANILHYCFRITLPTTDPLAVGGGSINQMQGRAVSPEWTFFSTSN